MKAQNSTLSWKGNRAVSFQNNICYGRNPRKPTYCMEILFLNECPSRRSIQDIAVSDDSFTKIFGQAILLKILAQGCNYDVIAFCITELILSRLTLLPVHYKEIIALWIKNTFRICEFSEI
ncbi:hypothetical protein TNIN_332501 [Trichonephila inaurata madagascariensis]|uniref:Uncharacterized protein n=1 Tax=Trichonephila inaurata madagascariensis TaxID=2747483 RepID=A0A8X7C8M3_9ARAC|nr:hypothetical protein TNIN_332501 [Trichonephila inaurata madagascariensis]